MWRMILLLAGLLLVALALTHYKSVSKTQPQPQSSPEATTSPSPTQASEGTAVAETSKPDFPKMQVFAKDLQVPWAIVFLPDSGMLVTERAGRVRFIDKDGNLKSEPIATISEVRQIGEGGLHGIALDPDFEENRQVFIYYTYRDSGENTLNRVSSFKFDGSSFSDQKIIVDKIPGAPNHDGGRIKFGPDKALYITTGDATNPTLSQDKNSLAGKILRYRDGRVEFFSYGHRNPQGIAWDNGGKFWEVEHGASATDEINLITQGKNYGWPEIRGDQKTQGMESPVLHSGSITWAPAGMTYYSGSLYFGGLRGQALFEFNTASSKLEEHFKGEFGRIREVILGPDNMLYITTSNKDGRGNPTNDDDRIIRINPERL